MSSSYEQTDLNKGKRYAARCNYDKQAIESVLRSTPLLHVSFNAPSSDSSNPESAFPSTLPMLGALGTYDPSPTAPSAPGAFDPPTNNEAAEPAVYLHGSSASRLSRLTSSSPDGLPVTIAATVLDGYVLALTPFSHSCNYRSAIIFGHAKLVTDDAEIAFAMECITNRLVPDRWANSRTPATKAEVTATGILRVEIVSASAKVRAGGPHDDRKDLKNEEMRERVWTGVVPVYETLGELVPAPDNRVQKVPGYLEGWARQANAGAKAHAESVAED